MASTAIMNVAYSAISNIHCIIFTDFRNYQLQLGVALISTEHRQAVACKEMLVWRDARAQVPAEEQDHSPIIFFPCKHMQQKP